MSSQHLHLSAHGTRRGSADKRRSHPLAVRVCVLCRWRRLDEMIAQGADPRESPELSRRAAQLTRKRHRGVIADSLEEVILLARNGTGAMRSARAPIARHEVRAAAPALLELARDLRECPEVEPRGVVLAGRLLTDGTGPLYVYGQNDALWRAVREADAALFQG